MNDQTHVPEAAQWMYQGVWRVLSDWFRVPRQPPALPSHADESIAAFRPARQWLNYMLVQYYISWTVFGLMSLTGMIVMTIVHPLLGLLAGFPLFVFFACLATLTHLALYLQFDSTWYVLSPRSLRLRRGIWTIHESTITFENIQNVSVSQGPLQRMFGIADVVVQTAGGGGMAAGAHGAAMHGGHVGLLEGLENAAAVRDLLLGKLRQSTSAGLGDERSPAERSAPTSFGASYGPAASRFDDEQIALLREIRAAAERLAKAS
ncbi:MAG: PH domain-containing protein [Pirellulales bacterium]